jgi:hypothetical protein
MPITVAFPEEAHRPEDRVYPRRTAGLVRDDHHVIGAAILKMPDHLTERRSLRLRKEEGIGHGFHGTYSVPVSNGPETLEPA